MEFTGIQKHIRLTLTVHVPVSIVSVVTSKLRFRLLQSHVDLRYTGVRKSARVLGDDGAIAEHALNGPMLELEVTVPAGGMAWFVIE